MSIEGLAVRFSVVPDQSSYKVLRITLLEELVAVQKGKQLIGITFRVIGCLVMAVSKEANDIGYSTLSAALVPDYGNKFFP